MRRFFDGTNVLLILAIGGGALWAWPHLPSQIPTHFGMDGRPDAWSARTLESWFMVPGIALLMTAGQGFLRTMIRRKPGWVNLPGTVGLEDLPEKAREPVLELLSGFLALVQTEVLVIFGLIQWATYRTAMGQESQGIMVGVLILAVTASPFLMVVLFSQLPGAMERAKRLAARLEGSSKG